MPYCKNSMTYGVGLIICCFFFTKEAPSPTLAPSIRGVSTPCRSFADIKITLANTTAISVFLSRVWPTAARLQRLNPATGKWEFGGWPIRCGTVVDASKPIEIKPGASRAMDLEWDLSVDDRDQPKWFITADDTQRALSGTYRIVLEYSEEPWTVFHRPKRVLNTFSTQFVLHP